MYLAGIANARLGGVRIVSARTRIHGSNQHEACRIIEAVSGTGYGYMPVFQGLAKNLQDTATEFGKFVKEKQTIMGQTDFSRLGIASTAYHGNLRNGMMRTSKRTGSDE